MISTRGLKSPKYAIGERVLCYEPDESKARVLYDSKVLGIDWTRDEGGKRVPEYLVHFTGWNSSWDRWAPEDFILEYTEEHIDLQETLQQEAMEKLQTKKKRKKKMTISELVKEAKRKKRGDSSSRSATSSAGDSDDSDDSSNDEYEWQPKEVPINLPEPLRAKLEDDCYFISYKNQLIKLPCKPTILTVLESYVKYFAAKHPPQEIVYPPTVLGGLTGMAKEPIQPPPLPQHNAELVKEVMDGIRVLFDFTIGTNLLYATERDQFNKEVATAYLPGYKKPETPVKRGRGRPPKHPKTPSPPVLEAQTKVDFSRTKPEPQESCDTKDDVKKEEPEEKEEAPTRRITRRLSCSSLNNPSASSNDAESKRQRSESGPRSSQRGIKTRSESVTSDSSEGHPTTHRPGLRHSARLSSHGLTSAPPEITREVPILLSPRERRKLEQDAVEKPKDKPNHKEKPDSSIKDNHKSGQNNNNNKGSETSKQNGKDKQGGKSTKHNGVNGSAAAVAKSNKNTFSCKLLADDANYAGRRPPVMIYGAQHLLRLFVKLPDILGKMDLPPKKLKALVKHLELFLKYLSAPEQLEAFFPDSAYVDAYAYTRTKKK